MHHSFNQKHQIYKSLTHAGQPTPEQHYHQNEFGVRHGTSLRARNNARTPGPYLNWPRMNCVCLRAFCGKDHAGRIVYSQTNICTSHNDELCARVCVPKCHVITVAMPGRGPHKLCPYLVADRATTERFPNKADHFAFSIIIIINRLCVYRTEISLLAGTAHIRAH